MMTWLEEQQDLNRKIDALNLNPQEWARGLGQHPLTHWTGVTLSAPKIRAGDTPEYIKAIDRYVARLSPEERAARKQLFLDYKEAWQFIQDLEDWLNEQLSDSESIKQFISGSPRDIIKAAQLTDKVPSDLRKRLEQAQTIIERWNETSSELNCSLCIFADFKGEEKPFDIWFEFLSPQPTHEEVQKFAQKMGIETWELKVENATSIKELIEFAADSLKWHGAVIMTVEGDKR